MQNLPKYNRAKLDITVFDNDCIFTDLTTSNNLVPITSDDMLPVILEGRPITGIGGSDITGTRDNSAGTGY